MVSALYVQRALAHRTGMHPGLALILVKSLTLTLTDG